MNRLVAMGCTLILGWPGRLFAAQVIVCVQRPIRVTQQFTRQQDQVGLPTVPVAMQASLRTRSAKRVW